MTENRTTPGWGIGPPPWPREHGAWAMLFLPMAVGCAVAGRLSAAAGSIALALLLCFLARAAAVPTLARRLERRPLASGLLRRRLAWSALYGAGALAAVGFAYRGATADEAAALSLGWIAPLGLGLFHAALGIAGRDRGLWGEMAGMAGLASATPLLAAAAGTAPSPRTWGAAALVLAYFLSSLAFVRAYRKRKLVGRIDVRSCVWAHAGIVAALGVLWALDWLPAAALAAFVPVLARTVWGLTHPPRDLAALGWREVGVALTFTLAALASFLV